MLQCCGLFCQWFGQMGKRRRLCWNLTPGPTSLATIAQRATTLPLFPEYRFVISSRLPWPTIVAAIAVVLALVTGFWAFSLRGDVTDLEGDNRALASEVELLRQQANATAYHLAPTGEAPPNATGTAFFSLDGTGVISVSNLAPAPEGRSYQIWYFPSPDAEPLPGAAFTVDANGSGFMLIPADVGLFTDVTITLEPETGSTAPTGPIYLSGSTGGARG